MKLPPFAYLAPQSVEEAVAVLAERGDDAKVLAGGQSLLPLMALRTTLPATLVDIGAIPDLVGVRRRGRDLAIGAGTPQRAVELSADVGASSPLLAEAVPLIAHRAIRTRGTIGGSLAHAAPTAELPAVALALDAELVARSSGGERTIAASDFFVGRQATALRPDELLTEILVGEPGPHMGTSVLEVSRRAHDFALVCVATVLRLEGDVVADARLVFAGVADVPVRARAAEQILIGEKGTTDVFEAAGAQAAAELDPPTDLHGTTPYRRHLARVLARRSLTIAADRARG